MHYAQQCIRLVCRVPGRSISLVVCPCSGLRRLRAPSASFFSLALVFLAAVFFPRGSYAGIHSSSFRDFLLKPELLNAVADAGFEHPSEGSLRFLIVCALIVWCNSSARMSTASHSGNGYRLSGQVRHGQNGRVRAGRAATIGGDRWRDRHPCALPHSRACVPDLSGDAPFCCLSLG